MADLVVYSVGWIEGEVSRCGGWRRDLADVWVRGEVLDKVVEADSWRGFWREN